MLKVRPLHDRLLVRRIEEKETAKGGIIIPDTAKENPQRGEVLAARGHAWTRRRNAGQNGIKSRLDSAEKVLPPGAH